MTDIEVSVGVLEDLDNPGCREFSIGDGDWPFKGFVVRQGSNVYAYQNFCAHVGHPLNWAADAFLTKDRSQIICASHGAVYEIDSGVWVCVPCKSKAMRPVAGDVRDGTSCVRGPESA